ncbi:hypothetical protein BSI_26850 [Bacillus inaquosorum KCTC 13429]|uniref:Uncharacterized protein n=1 Tax=Bacillus inaquosorum KCTC 13429 TaxID=1236548 RepID=A0A9W5LI71_9BACI|nr:hypothetical protein BSI_26850 [Bacillus inaquosorum KCTC 13429]
MRLYPTSNAPTVLLQPSSEAERLARMFSGLVFIDEFYKDFAVLNTSEIPLI